MDGKNYDDLKNGKIIYSPGQGGFFEGAKFDEEYFLDIWQDPEDSSKYVYTLLDSDNVFTGIFIRSTSSGSHFVYATYETGTTYVGRITYSTACFRFAPNPSSPQEFTDKLNKTGVSQETIELLKTLNEKKISLYPNRDLSKETPSLLGSLIPEGALNEACQ